MESKPSKLSAESSKVSPQPGQSYFADPTRTDFFLTPDQKKKRQLLIGGLNVVGYGTSILIFNNQWYKNHPKTSFHTFDDSKEWLQMDKLGHVWASYNAGRASAAMWRWAGVSDKNATWIGGLSSTVYLTVIEFLDAHSTKWGWSWADIGANLFGSGLFIAQQLAWNEQRIQMKFSFHRQNYSEPMLKQRANDLFGSSWTERMLKDYNGQTYWLSVNLQSFFPYLNLPPWLNLAVGYGADGMFGGFENRWTDGDPGLPVDRTDIKRYRQWYLAPDINFSKIRTNSKAVRVLFGALDAFKFPTPSLEFSNRKLTVNALHF
ncbi:MAG TPA: DUF2279 domain-containing protein [Chitinophagaceae bacterium]|nr:DUF2279 domain-containing protein [Chitinophagaceae bacterium]